ncbi:Nitric oxide reductase subunit B [Candidatus Sulfobium mesophilum]|uniref:Nitric oxide reductase subunit B n=1 Tax=Candidatus Sulfobium mesophilum TaxID=2016548 RepID=A0A2U3QHM3_9BACT|nr:Nitric oxide reductase subunit B [Candidatus Sulfobium mesophilum]
MKYETQKIAYNYFVVATLLFGLQVIFGLITGAKYVWDHDPLINILPFNTSRAIHINLLVVWLLFGFMGGTYYLVPEESETEIWSPKLANIQLILFASVGVAAIAGYLFGWSWGMPFLEQPTILKVGIVVVALMFLFNILKTMMKTKRWTVIQGVLLGGLVMLAGMFIFGIFFVKNLTTQYYYWWWVIHLWVEGAWELVAGSIMAFILLKLTGVDREIVEKWLYVEVGLVLFTGIAGTGHHYYWIGTPYYWLWVGGIFSALEPVPILFMVIDTLRDVRERKVEIENRTALFWAVGCAVMHFFGAGVWGFAHTLPQINKWTHGTQITASHGHFAFFGAYAMLNLTLIYFAVPKLKGIKTLKSALSLSALRLMVFSMFLMVLALAVAGIVQVYLQRILGMDYLSTQGFMTLWYAVFWVCAWGFASGVVLYIIDFFSMGKTAKS